jgi:hypothetical protein
MHFTRFLLCSLLTLGLSQCAGPQRTLAPLLDRNGEVVLLSLKNGASPSTYRESAFMAAAEKCSEHITKSNAVDLLAEKHLPKATGETPQKTVAFAAALGFPGSPGMVETKSGEVLMARLCGVELLTVGMAPAAVNSMIPEVQKAFLAAATKEFRVVPVSSLKKRNQWSANTTKYLKQP